MDILPDAPWIVESWYTGNDPDYVETPYDICSDEQFLEAADSEFGWRILAWELDVDDSKVDDSTWQDIWCELSLRERKRLCESYQRWHRDDSAELYNTYWRTWIGG